MPNELSWWQKQRVAIARAIVVSPSIILADEPTWALDTKTWNEIMNIFCELNNEWKTIIVITHEPEIAEQTKKIIHIRDGNILDNI
jgi:putative ABC transport system ATP-binding protein